MKKIYALLCFLITTISFGQIVNPVSATTTFTGDFGTIVDATIDGTGLVTFPSLTSDHEATIPGNSFLAFELAGSIDYDLGGTFAIDGLSFWNQNSGGPDPTYGLNEVRFSYSLDGVTYDPIPGAPTSFAIVTFDPAPPEIFTFTAVNAAFIRMEVLTNHGGPSSGYAEIAFSGNTLSIVDFESNAGAQLYPNPAREQIQISGLTDTKNYVIYNILGAAIKSGSVSNNGVIQLDNMTSGMYFIKLDSGNTIKFIKE